MRFFAKTSLILVASLLAMSIADTASARPRGSVQVGSASSGNVALPGNLTTNKDWLDDGAENDMRPNAEANDRYFLEQENFAANDPTRYSMMGSYLDSWPGMGW